MASSLEWFLKTVLFSCLVIQVKGGGNASRGSGLLKE